MKILLHIGQSKTGTSAIQSFLGLNRNRLRENGVIYPAVKVDGISVEIGSHNPVADALVGRLRYPFLSADEYFSQFFAEAKASNANRIILSAEHFFGGEPRIWDVSNEHQYMLGYRKKVEALGQFLIGHEVTIIVYLRPQVDWLASTISQTVKIEGLINRPRIYKNDKLFFEKAKPLLRYFTLLNMWRDILSPSKIIAIPYERSRLHKQSSAADFLRRAQLGTLDLPHVKEAMQVNQSISREYVEVKKMLNRLPKSKHVERAIIICLERLSRRKKHFVPYQLAEEVSLEIEGFVEVENAQLNHHYIKGDVKLYNRSQSPRALPNPAMKKVQIDTALKEFKDEFALPRYRLVALNYAAKDFLRKDVRVVHSLLHQIKRLYGRLNNLKS